MDWSGKKGRPSAIRRVTEAWKEATVHFRVGLPSDGQMEADGKASLVGQGTESPHVRKAGSHVVERGHAVAEGLFPGQFHLAKEAGMALLLRQGRFGAGLGPTDESLGRLPQETGGVSLGLPEDGASPGLRGVPVHAGQFQGPGVGEGGVSAGMGEKNRILWTDLAQRMMGRHPVKGGGWGRAPPLVVPSPPQDP